MWRREDGDAINYKGGQGKKMSSNVLLLTCFCREFNCLSIISLSPSLPEPEQGVIMLGDMKTLQICN
jgi:hypothetical protein